MIEMTDESICAEGRLEIGYDGDGKLVLMDVGDQVRRTSQVRRTVLP